MLQTDSLGWTDIFTISDAIKSKNYNTNIEMSEQ